MTMPVYLITPLANNFGKVLNAVAAKISEDDYLALQKESGVLVSYRGTSVELSHHLGITSKDRSLPSTTGSAMVTAVGSYFGRGPSTMWEWLKIRFER